MWINRLLEIRLRQSARTRPVVLVTGARQTGKSSLLQHAFPELTYITLDSVRQSEMAHENPEYFLQSFADPVILDEVQYAPDLFRHLKIRVDQNRDDYGRWLLTGSQKFELMTTVSESLAGRISILHLETLSAEELRHAAVANFPDLIWKGGYPEIWANPDLNVEDFFESYIQTYLERDLKAIINVSSLQDFQRFLRIAATRVGQLINYRDFANDVGVSDVTIKKWLSAMEQGGIIYLLPPYFANIGKRLVKSPKLYFSDHGLVCFLLNINSMASWQQHVLKGNLWENFVFSELVKAHHLKPGAQLFFYRDQNAVEMDFVIERAGKLYLIEAKSTETTKKRKLNFKKIVPLFKDKKVVCLLAANIPETGKFNMGEYVLYNPIHTLCPL